MQLFEKPADFQPSKRMLEETREVRLRCRLFRRRVGSRHSAVASPQLIDDYFASL